MGKIKTEKNEYLKKIFCFNCSGGVRDVMVNIVGNGHGDSSSNP